MAPQAKIVSRASAARDLRSSREWSKLHQSKYMQNIFSDHDRRIISLRYLWLQNQLNDPSGFRTKLDEYAEKRNSRHKNGEDIAELTEFAEV